MAANTALLMEFDYEMANTRKTLDRVLEDKLGWKPHEKSTTMGRLAMHLAEIPGYAKQALEQNSLDVAPPGGASYRPVTATSRKEILASFDKNVSEARAAIAAASEERLMEPWSLLSGGKTIFTLPRAGVLRSFVMNHSIHHRAQLGVYLRLNNVPVPAIYGPSADEAAF
jgi:uncharacterized damage-inducible protein DinB